MRFSMREAYQSRSPKSVMPFDEFSEGSQFLAEAVVEALRNLL